jgi:hypothetical protein
MNQHSTPVTPVTVFDPLQNYLDNNETTSSLNESTENQEHPLNIFMASSETSDRKGKQKAKQKKKSDADIVDEDDEEEDEPTIGDGALSCSSNGSRRSENSPLTKEDKRRRNTAASARFRFKKKMREQALQKTACDMTEKTRHMEDRIHDLEREIKWLKSLVVEKNDSRIEQLIQERPTHIKL